MLVNYVADLTVFGGVGSSWELFWHSTDRAAVVMVIVAR